MDVMMLCREKIRRDTAQLELNLATARKRIKDVSINTSATKGLLRRISVFIGSGRNSDKG